MQGTEPLPRPEGQIDRNLRGREDVWGDAAIFLYTDDNRAGEMAERLKAAVC